MELSFTFTSSFFCCSDAAKPADTLSLSLLGSRHHGSVTPRLSPDGSAAAAPLDLDAAPTIDDTSSLRMLRIISFRSLCTPVLELSASRRGQSVAAVMSNTFSPFVAFDPSSAVNEPVLPPMAPSPNMAVDLTRSSAPKRQDPEHGDRKRDGRLNRHPNPGPGPKVALSLGARNEMAD